MAVKWPCPMISDAMIPDADPIADANPNAVHRNRSSDRSLAS